MKTHKIRFFLPGLLGAFALFSHAAFAAAPANDNFANAQIVAGDPPTIAGNNMDATWESGEPAAVPEDAGSVGKSVWFKWTPANSGKAFIDTKGTRLPLSIGIFTGSTVNALTRVTGNDDAVRRIKEFSTVEFEVVSNTNYYIQVASSTAGDGYGAFTLNLKRTFNLSGRVTNTSGVGIRDIRVAAKNLNVNNVSETLTDASGYYTLKDIIAGTYLENIFASNLTFTPASRQFETPQVTTGLNFVATTNVKPSINITNTTQVEGDSGSQNAVFEVKLSAPSALPVTVSYVTSNDTAVAPNDFNAAANTLTFAPGETLKTINIAVKGDLIDEIDERYNVNLSNPVNATINDALGVGFITDDDAAPVLSINSPSISEGNTGTKLLNFTFKLNTASSRTVTVSAKTIDGVYTETTDVATAGVDYVALPATTISFAPGELTKTVGVTVKADVLDEANETINLVPSAPGNVTIGTVVSIATITDDDAAPGLSINDVSLTEPNGGTTNAGFNVKLSAASGRKVTVYVATQDGTTQVGSDYIPLDYVTVTFSPGQTSKTVNVAVRGDFNDEADEIYLVKLVNPTNAGVTDGTGLGTIIDNDNPPTISVAAPSVSEGNESFTFLPFVLKLSAASGKPITVKVQTIAAATDPATVNVDYTPAALTTVTIPAGVSQQTFEVRVFGDLIDEPNEKIGLTLSAPNNATLLTTKVEGTILDDDATPSILVPNLTAAEGDSASRIVDLFINLSNPSSKPVSINFKTGPSTDPFANLATAGVDYLAIPQTTITFAPGETVKTVPITLFGDIYYEENEHFNCLFSNPVNATIEGNSRDITISNDDALPEFSINSVSVKEGESGTSLATLEITLSRAHNTDVTIRYNTSPLTATEGEDYVGQADTLTFTPGQLSKKINIVINGDTTFENDEYFHVMLNESVGAGIQFDKFLGLVTITNDDKSGGVGRSVSRS